MKKYIISFSVLCLTFTLAAQNMGVIQNESASFQGYTLFSPTYSESTYLVDNCGQLINEWDRGLQPGFSSYLLEDGTLLRSYKAVPLGPFPASTGGSSGGGLELIDWDNTTLWSYEFNTSTMISHHDAIAMPNGNFLLMIWEIVEAAEIIDLGRDPNQIGVEGNMWAEKIIEVKPIGTDDIDIVWEWNMKDHFIQDFDPTKQNYGVIAEHPELFDINFLELIANSGFQYDWFHFNSIDYNETLDQILISSRQLGEVFIIDHSTTTSEAATHSGGLSGKGGDILYRWGNPMAYDRGTEADLVLSAQHGANWIDIGLEGEGNILVFNNNFGVSNASNIVEIITPLSEGGNYEIAPGQPFEPALPVYVYGNEPDEEIWSPYMSNAQRLPNGNTLINQGYWGDVIEIDEDKNIVWNYINPVMWGFPGTQGGSIINNQVFYAFKYDKNYLGFQGLDLTPGDVIETGGNPYDCTLWATPPIAQFEMETTIGCAPFSAQFTDVSLNEPTAWDWTISGATTSQSMLQNPTFSLETAGLYNVQLIVSNSSNADTIYQEAAFEVLPLPIADFDFTLIDNVIEVQNNSSNGLDYEWSFGDGAESTDENPIHSYDNSGIYTITLSTTNDCGTDMIEQVVEIILNSDKETLLNNGLKVHPNPSQGYLTLTFSELQAESSLEVFNIAGNTVFFKQNKNLNETTTVNLAHLPSGLYMLKVQHGDFVYFEKIVLE